MAAKGVDNFSELENMIATLSELNQKLSLDFNWSYEGDPPYNQVHMDPQGYHSARMSMGPRPSSCMEAIRQCGCFAPAAIALRRDGGPCGSSSPDSLRSPGAGDRHVPTAAITPSTRSRSTLELPSSKRCYLRWTRSSTPSPPRVTFWDSGMSKTRLTTQSCGEPCLMLLKRKPNHTTTAWHCSRKTLLRSAIAP